MNRLAGENSPYLRQHADNPVDWYPWGDEPFEVARRLDVPVFISIGYSACHWCHVMAHESFEDEATAALLNERFVSVKVDREEHPDVDAVYMEAVQAMTGGGGWPLTVFTDADRRPFFGGTYFGREGAYGRPSFTAVIDAVTNAWTGRRDEITKQAGELARAVEERLQPPTGGAQTAPAGELLRRGVERFAAIFDPEFGGTGRSPKFPQAPMLELLLRADQAGIQGAMAMLEVTLAAMASGGIYDHLGGGFARYSVDRTWTVPHFEKMLYDQASLARLYLHAHLATGDERWRQVAAETLDYVLRDLALPSGGIASAEDADSEGEEGRFYVWTPGQVTEALEAAGAGGDADVVADWYGLDRPPNFEEREHVLVRARRGDLVRPEVIERARRILEAARARRIRPGLDDKVLTEWNAMIAGVLAEAGAALGEDRFTAAALRIGDFLLASLRREDGRWLRSFQDGNAAHLAVASDYAWLVDCFTRLGELSGERRWLAEAHRTAEDLCALFDAPDGGFYLSGADATGLPIRPRDSFDGVLPAACSAAASALARLGALLGDETLVARARRAVASVGDVPLQHPLAFSHLIGAAVMLEQGALELVVPGDHPEFRERATGRYLPDVVLAWGEGDGVLFKGKQDGLAYLCRGGICAAPAATPEALTEQLDRALAPR